MDFKIDEITGEPTVPLDEPWKRREWENYLRMLGKRCLEEANERLGHVWENLPKPIHMTRATIRKKRAAWLARWKAEHSQPGTKRKIRRSKLVQMKRGIEIDLNASAPKTPTKTSGSRFAR